MVDKRDIHTAIRLNNRVWWCLYYDELYESDHFQCTFMRNADDGFYNCAQAIIRADDEILDFVAKFYEPNFAPAVYVDPASPEALVSMLHARGYVPVPDEREFWYRYDLRDDLGHEAVLKVDSKRVEVLRVNSERPELDDFVQVDQEANTLPDSIAADIHRNLRRRRLGDVEWVLLLALLDGKPAATAAVGLCQNMAFLAESGTVPGARRLGLNSLLNRTRLQVARDAGAKVAFATTSPNTTARQTKVGLGFDLAWTRTYFRYAGQRPAR
ncbi:hypothetical protein [Nocardia sp. NPDC005998]|uniref:hypothetical protein n=1 Tax=Nocardia sp. NPDC005998 TaxID=3156894 RepID=UPI0033A3F88F